MLGLQRRVRGATTRSVVGPVLALACFAGAGVFLAGTLRFNLHAQHVEGVVVGYRRHRGSTHLLVRYGVEGRTWEVEGDVGTSRLTLDIGDKVSVYYLPSRPAEGQICTLSQVYLVPLLLCGLGFLFLGGVIYERVWARRWGGDGVA